MHNHPRLGCRCTSGWTACARNSTLGLLGGYSAVQLDTIAPCGFFGTDTLHLVAELDDDAVMDHAVDGSCRGQGINEDFMMPLSWIA
jgi:hypothetical protein